MMKTIICVSMALFIPAPLAFCEEFVDGFGGPKLEGRLAERGEWKFQNGIASCVADPDLYKQFKNHGPILKWPREFNNARIQFESQLILQTFERYQFASATLVTSAIHDNYRNEHAGVPRWRHAGGHQPGFPTRPGPSSGRRAPRTPASAWGSGCTSTGPCGCPPKH